MCLLFIKLSETSNPDEYKLILVNVRDEFLHRPTKRLAFWTNGNIVGGQDLEAGREGGTWLAMNQSNGKIGILLNILQCDSDRDLNKIGRGNIVTDFLMTNDDDKYLSQLVKNSDNYNGFTFVGIRVKPEVKAAYVTGIAEKGVINLPKGVHGFGNSESPREPWNKVKYGREKFSTITGKYTKTCQKDELVRALFSMLLDETKLPNDPQMRKQAGNWPDEHINRLNRLFVQIPEKKYGTRTLTIILVDGKGLVDYIEKTRTEPMSFTENEIKSEWMETKLNFQL